nr:MAG TPA: hypothetical protein [Caudoviricetes sp.]
MFFSTKIIILFNGLKKWVASYQENLKPARKKTKTYKTYL